MTVTGTVLSKTEQDSLPGISVVEKGTQNGTVTDMEGHFILKVSNVEATLVFSFVGMQTREYTLEKGSTRNILVELKADCHKDFFDAQLIKLSVQSGVINTPIGGKISLSSPWTRIGVFKGYYSYQGNLEDNIFQKGGAGLYHSISNCDMDIDFKWRYRKVNFSTQFTAESNHFETALNLRNLKLMAGYASLRFHNLESSTQQSSSGVLLGIGHGFSTPMYFKLVGKVALYRHQQEYRVAVQSYYKRFFYFANFYKLDTFNEFNLGFGMRFYYRLKKQRN